MITTYLVNIIRGCRFGNADATGRANLIIYNFLAENGVLARKSSGHYSIDYSKAVSVLSSLGELVLYMQATGDLDAATEFVSKYAVVPSTIKADIVNLELEKIPVDIRINYEY